MDADLCVRVDFYSDGKMVPISFIQNKVTTKYIRMIKRVWYEADVNSQEVIKYSCVLTDETTTILSYKSGRWYIEESVHC